MCCFSVLIELTCGEHQDWLKIVFLHGIHQALLHFWTMWWWDTFWPMNCGPTTPIWMFSCWHETFLWGSHLGDKTHSTWWQEDTRARTGLAYPAAPVKRWLEGRIMLHVTLWSQTRFNYDSVFSPSWLMCKLCILLFPRMILRMNRLELRMQKRFPHGLPSQQQSSDSFFSLSLS